MAVFSSISDTGYDTVITTLGQQDLRNAVWFEEINMRTKKIVVDIHLVYTEILSKTVN